MARRKTLIEKLSQEKLRKINNMILTGSELTMVAREIHSWGILMNVAEMRLIHMLKAYRDQYLGTIVLETPTGEIKIVGELQQARFDALHELQLIAEKQRNRVQALLDMEAINREHMSIATVEIQTLSMLLKDVLRAEFDCGARQYLGPMGGKGGGPKTAEPGEIIEGHVVEAVDHAMEIMQRTPPKQLIHAES